jgi:hypothetical protein
MLGLLAGGLMLGGGLMKGFGAMQEGKFQNALTDFNARQSFIDARIARENADAQAKQIRQQGRQLTGTQRTRYAKSGVRMEGTPLEVMAKTIENVELDAIAKRQAGEFEAQQHIVKGRFEKEMGKRHSKAGTLGMISGAMGGVTGAMGMFG